MSLEKNDVDDVELQNDHTDTLTTLSKTMVIPNLKTSSGKDILNGWTVKIGHLDA